MTYEEKYKKLVEIIHKELSYSQSKVKSNDVHSDFALVQSGKVLAFNNLLYDIKQMEREDTQNDR